MRNADAMITTRCEARPTIVTAVIELSLETYRNKSDAEIDEMLFEVFRQMRRRTKKELVRTLRAHP